MQCSPNTIGEITTNIKGLVTDKDPTATSSYDIHFDDAPAFYVNGQPPTTDAAVRKLERDVGGLTATDPYVRVSGVPQTVSLTDALADPVELQALHMVNTDPLRTPTFVEFGNPDYFFQTSNPASPCAVRRACTRASPGTTATSSRRSVTRGPAWSGLELRRAESTRTPGPTTRTCARRSSRSWA